VVSSGKDTKGIGGGGDRNSHLCWHMVVFLAVLLCIQDTQSLRLVDKLLDIGFAMIFIGPARHMLE
jgi:hypothetical protein